ncbi:MAG: molybdopterin molybdotransferase MoeA [Actinobacteria bacterium]|nr:MAG: molybdopterin molybdotransferase MoeA [Actinomycetota bacterium]
MADLLTIAEAQRLILEHAGPLPAESVTLEDAARRVLAEPARAEIDLPPFPSSAMDGYAVRAADTPGRLRIEARIAAGRPAAATLESGQAMGIATGGVVPEGADAVVPIESVVEHDNEVEIDSGVERGDNVRPRGGDIQAGETVAEAGSVLTPARLGALAAAGIAQVRCARRPRAAVLPTGTELRRPGEVLAAGEIYEANGLILSAQLDAAGAIVELMPAVGDDEAKHRDALERALGADVVVTSGGVSVGPHDLVRRVEAELGVEEMFWRVSVKPGKPIAFGVRERTLVFGLPGNPVSALVGFVLFVEPAIRALQGVPEPLPRFDRGRLAGRRRRNRERDELLRSRLRRSADGAVLEPLSGQESHMIARSAAADALVFVPRGEGALDDGALVDYLRLD